MDRILTIDDDAPLRDSVKLTLEGKGYKVYTASDGSEGLALVEAHSPDLIILDLIMPGMHGIEVLRKIRKYDPNVFVIILTGFEKLNYTIEAMQNGAYDYITKPVDAQRLLFTISRALESKRLSERLNAVTMESANEFNLDTNFIGQTPSMREIFKKIGQVSTNRVSILIQGESGTGKELLSRIIHHSGITRNEPFVAVNCSALTETLLESELFGHVKGAFTGATRDKKGKFELAGEGTILLDEISDISHDLQIKLLRVLQEKSFEKVGGEELIPMKARVIATTNRNLAELVKNEKFRMDLYYRLNVISIEIAPLRKRREDIPRLVIHFLGKINNELHKNVVKVPYEVMEILQNHDWVGNVRELENVLLQALVLAKGDVLEREYIKLPDYDLLHNKIETGDDLSLSTVEKFHIKKVLDKTNWDKQKTAELLGITRPTLYRKIQLYNLQ